MPTARGFASRSSRARPNSTATWCRSRIFTIEKTKIILSTVSSPPCETSCPDPGRATDGLRSRRAGTACRAEGVVEGQRHARARRDRRGGDRVRGLAGLEPLEGWPVAAGGDAVRGAAQGARRRRRQGDARARRRAGGEIPRLALRVDGGARAGALLLRSQGPEERQGAAAVGGGARGVGRAARRGAAAARRRARRREVVRRG